MRVSRISVLIAGVLLLPWLPAATGGAAAADETIGSLKKVSGEAAVLRSGERLPARTGFKLHAGDALETGPDGSLGLTFRDDSLVSLGPSSRIAIERFEFVPAKAQLGLTVRLVRGTLAYVSGLIARLAPEAATFVTPSATIGVRGTRFAARVSD
jgi:hypothetical protein